MAVPFFQPKITKARLVLSPFTSEQMLTIGNALSSSIITRIKSGKNANDEDAKPLKGARGNYVPYARWKMNHGLAPIRDWTGVTGRLLRSLKVLSVNENAGKIGFTDRHSDNVAHALNKIEKAFGISPNDRQAMNEAVLKMVRGGQNVQLRKVA